MKLPIYLNHLKPFILPKEYGPTSFFNQYRHFGPSYTECSDLITRDSYDAVFISLFSYCYAGEAIDFAKILKKSYKRPILIGGAGVTVFPELFEKEFPGTVLSGRAERVIPRFLEREPEISDSRFIWNTAGRLKGRVQVSVMLSRGCPKQCGFCANHLVHGREFRKASLGDILKGLKEIPSGDSLHINFEDDNILIDSGYFLKVLKKIRNRFPGTTFSAENGLDYNLLSRETMEELIRLGFISFRFTLASTKKSILQGQNRTGSSSHLQSLLETAWKKKIPSTVYFICGLPGDKKEYIARNLLFLDSLPALSGISMFYPVPGIPGFENPDIMRQHHPGLFKGTSAYPWNGISANTLLTAFRLSRFINLKKKSLLNSAEKEIIHTIAEKKRLYTLRRDTELLYPVPGTDSELEGIFFAYSA